MYVDAAYCYRPSNVVSLSACLSVCHTSEPCKTAEPIEMPFVLMTRVSPRNHVIRWGPQTLMGSGNFEGEGAARCKVQGHLSSVQKRLNRSRYRLGYGLGWAQGITY